MKEIKTQGSFRKSKAYGLIGCLALFSIIITNPVLNVKAEEFNRTDSGQVDSSNTSVNKLIPSEEIKSIPNGERNFYSTVAFTTEAGLGSGTLISPDTIVTVAHNFVHLNEKTNPISVDNNVNKSGDIHIATLPNGKQVKFSNDDVHFWNREGFVNGYKNDLVVIKLKKSFDSQPAELTDSVKTLSNGDKIHVFGFPKGKLQPILNGTVENVENYGANIMGVSYQGSAPGMSGGGLYDSNGKLIGVNQNGVEGLRSGGITFSKEQLDWINSIVKGENAKPVYLEENRKPDEKDSKASDLKNTENDKDKIQNLSDNINKNFIEQFPFGEKFVDEDGISAIRMKAPDLADRFKPKDYSKDIIRIINYKHKNSGKTLSRIYQYIHYYGTFEYEIPKDSPVNNIEDIVIPIEEKGTPEIVEKPEYKEEKGTPEIVEKPEYKEEKGTPEILEKLEYQEEKGIPEILEKLEYQEEKGTPEILEKPEYKETKGTPEILDKPEYKEEKGIPEVLEKPEYKEEKNTPEVLDKPEYKEEKKVSQEKVKYKELPNTNSTSVIVGFVSSLIGTLGLGYKSKRRK